MWTAAVRVHSCAVRRSRHRLRLAVLLLFTAACGYAGLCVHPQIVFAHATRAGNVALHSRCELPARASEIAEEARTRVSRSPFYVPEDEYDVFLCDSRALFGLFAREEYKVGGITDAYVSRNVFLRPAHVERDRLVGYSGVEPAGERTLTYFVSHEITHVMVARRLGRIGFARLERWQREGYADYVAKAGRFDFDAALRDFKKGAAALDPARSGLYLRYHLLVAELVEHRGMSPQALLAGPIDAGPIERELARR